jgi:orotate phosphoribosyltransferase
MAGAGGAARRAGGYTRHMDRDLLIRRIRDTALLRGHFTLRSGRTSTYYLDKYRFETQPDILAELGRLFAARVEPGTTRLAGAELGGVPLVVATALASGLPCVFVRNARKEYGTARLLEGQLDPEDRVMLVEDVATTGGQVLEAARVVEQAGARVLKIVAVIDRQEGAAERIQAAGHRFESLFTRADLGVES